VPDHRTPGSAPTGPGNDPSAAPIV
jgi:hypothetical protein